MKGEKTSPQVEQRQTDLPDVTLFPLMVSKATAGSSISELYCKVWYYREYSNDIQTVRIADIDENLPKIITHANAQGSENRRGCTYHDLWYPMIRAPEHKPFLALSFLTDPFPVYARGKSITGYGGCTR